MRFFVFSIVCMCGFNGFALDGVALFFTKQGSALKMYDQQSGSSKTIGSKSAKAARFSPDGKKVAYGDGSTLRILDVNLNNLTGSNETSISAVPKFSPDRGEFAYTTNGIFWATKNSSAGTADIFRYDPDTDSYSKVKTLSGLKNSPGKGYFGSYDGTRAWIYLDIIPSYNPDRNGHGDMAYVEFNTNFSDFTFTGKPGVGYGHFLLMGGTHVMIGQGSTAEYRLLSFTETFLDDSDSPPQEEPVEECFPTNQTSNEGFFSKSGITPCVNNWRYVVIKDAAYKYHLLDLSDQSSKPVALKAPSGKDDYSGGIYMRSDSDTEWVPPSGSTRRIARRINAVLRGTFFATQCTPSSVIFHFNALPASGTITVVDMAGSVVFSRRVGGNRTSIAWGSRPAAGRYTAYLQTTDRTTTVTFSITGQ